MFRIMLKEGKKWKMGIVEYSTQQEAEARVQELNKVGHKCKAVTNEQVFNPMAKADRSMGIMGGKLLKII